MRGLSRLATALIAFVALILITAQIGASEPNPKSYVATASGTNTVLAAVTGQGYTIHAIALQSTDESTAKVTAYIASTTADLIGSATATTPIDKTGINGYQGFVWNYNPKGWASAPVGEPVNVVLSAAQPVIVNITYSLHRVDP